MTQIKLYMDEDAMARSLVRGLKARGVDVTTVLDVNKEGQSDVAQLEFAANQKLVLYSFNVGDFCRLHSEWMEQGKSHWGIIVVSRQRYSIGEQLRRLLKLISLKSAEDMRNNLEFLSK